MFGKLFGSRVNEPKDLFHDWIWYNTPAKAEGLAKRYQQTPNMLFVAWFPATAEKFKVAAIPLGIPAEALMMAKDVLPQHMEQKTVVWIEYHPLHRYELAFINRLLLPKVEVHSALDEGIMQFFGGEKIAKMMRMLGFKEHEATNHSSLSSTINKAQRKMADAAGYEQPADSAEEWLLLNVKR